MARKKKEIYYDPEWLYNYDKSRKHTNNPKDWSMGNSSGGDPIDDLLSGNKKKDTVTNFFDSVKPKTTVTTIKPEPQKEEGFFSFLKRKYNEANNAIAKANYDAGIRPRETTYEQDRKEQRDARERVANALPSILQSPLRKVNKALDNAEESKVGKWMGRTGEVGAKTAFFGKDEDVKTKTGSKLGDTSANIAGTLLGFVGPTPANTVFKGGTAIAEKGLQKFAPKLANSKLATNVIGGMGAGATTGMVEGITEGKNLKDTAKLAAQRAAEFGTVGAVGYGVAKGAGALARKFMSEGTLQKIDPKQFFEDVNNAYSTKKSKLPPAPIKEIGVKPSQGKYKVKNVALEKAFNDYNNAIETIQNRFGTNQLRKEEEALIKSELGIDLEKLVSNIEKAENSNPIAQLGKTAERNRFAQVAGLQDKPLLKFPDKSNLLNQTQPNKILNEKSPFMQLNAKEGAVKTPAGTPKPLANINTLLPPRNANIEPVDTSKLIATKTTKLPLNLPDKANRFYINMVDDVQRINQFDKFSEKALGKELKPSESAYKQALNSRGSDIVANEILTNKLVDPKGNVVGDGLASVTSRIPKGLESQFEDYLIHRHAPSWMADGKKVFPDEFGITPEASMAKVAEYETKYPEFKELGQKYNEFKQNFAKTWLVDTGLISPEAFDLWRQKYPNYVPLQRKMDELATPLFKGAKSGFANMTNPVKKAQGSQRQIISPIESDIEQIDKFVKTAKRNQVMQTIIGNVKQDPEAFKGWLEIVPDKKDLLGDINETLFKDGIEGVAEKFNNQFDEVFKRSKKLTDGNVVTGFVNGEKVHLDVKDPQLLEALTNINSEAQNIVVRAVGQVTRVMKTLTTGINPVFSLTRNIFRDIPQAYINSKTTNNPAVFAKDLVGSLVSALKNGELMQAYERAGGGHASSVAANRNLLAQSKAKILPGYIDFGKAPIRSAWRMAGQGMGKLENALNTLEVAPRLPEFKRVVEKGGDPIEGVFQANDVTVNFKRHGKWAKNIDAFIPYFNAAMQGLDKLGRTYKDNPIQATAKSVIGITIPTVLLYLANKDNPDYQKLNDHTKDTYYLFPREDGTFYKIPRPRETGVVFGSLVERELRAWQDNDPEAFKNFANTFMTAFMPPYRTIADPITRDLPSNQDVFNRPIVSRELEKLSPELQYDENTSEVSKFLGKLTNSSPKKIDYLGKSYLGVLGQLGIPATAKGSTVQDTLLKQVTADPLYSNDVLNNFYDKKTELDTMYNDIQHTRDLGGRSENEVRRNLELRKIYYDASKVFADIRKEIKAVENSNLSPEEKRQRSRLLQEKMQSLALEVTSKYK